MGQKQYLEEIAYGNNCLLGYNLAAPLWLLGETPKYIYMRFSVIKKCNTEFCVGAPSPWNDHCFKLTQSAVNPCKWTYTNDWMVTWQLVSVPPTYVHFELYHYPSEARYFYDYYNANDRDPRFTANTLGCEEIFTCGYNGIAIATWRLESIELMTALNIEKSNKILMEMRPLANGRKVYKFCGLRDSTNIAILLEP